MRQVEIADADGVDIAQRPDADLGGRPRSDQGSIEAARRRRPTDRRPAVRRWRPPGDRPDQVGPPTFDAERVVGPIRQGGERRGPRHDAQAEFDGARGGFAIAPYKAVIRAVRLGACDLLFEDRGDQRLEHGAVRRIGPRAASCHSDDSRITDIEKVVRSGAEQRRDRAKGLVGSRAPGIRAKPSRPGHRRADRRHPVRQPRRPPCPIARERIVRSP